MKAKPKEAIIDPRSVALLRQHRGGHMVNSINRNGDLADMFAMLRFAFL